MADLSAERKVGSTVGCLEQKKSMALRSEPWMARTMDGMRAFWTAGLRVNSRGLCSVAKRGCSTAARKVKKISMALR